MTHSYKEIFYPESRFGGFTDINSTMVFYTRINSLLDSSCTVLDVGCGRGGAMEDPIDIRRNLRDLKGKVRKVIGIDVGEAGKENPCLDEFRLIEGDLWPIEESTIDLIVCDCVLEHIASPDKFFSEVRRVLRNGGHLCLRTPNSWGYVALCARVIPNKLHARVTRMARGGGKEEDVFPTVYRCNSLWRIRSMMKQYGLRHVVYGYASEPWYFSFSRIAYAVGALYHKLIPAFLKPEILGFGQLKKDS